MADAVGIQSAFSDRILAAEAAGEARAKSPVAGVSARIEFMPARRGFDMLWISGREEVLHSLWRVFPNPLWRGLELQFHPVAGLLFL